MGDYVFFESHGVIASRVDLPELGTTEFVLSNGTRICYKCTGFLDDQTDLSLNEILSLQEEGPLDNDISTLLEIEQRTYENGLQENQYWLDRIECGYQSQIYDGDLNASIRVWDECRNKVRTSFSSLTMQSALQRLLPFPCKKRCTVVVLLPKS